MINEEFMKKLIDRWVSKNVKPISEATKYVEKYDDYERHKRNMAKALLLRTAEELEYGNKKIAERMGI